MATNDEGLLKLKPAIFPLGFSISGVGDEIVVLDFIDSIGGKMTVVESIALPRKRAEDLARAILNPPEDGSGDGAQEEA